MKGSGPTSWGSWRTYPLNQSAFSRENVSAMADAPPLTANEIEILRAAFHDGALRMNEGAILAIRTNIAFRSNDYVRAFRSLRARNYLKWEGHSVSGGELYNITPQGREAYTVTTKK